MPNGRWTAGWMGIPALRMYVGSGLCEGHIVWQKPGSAGRPAHPTSRCASLFSPQRTPRSTAIITATLQEGTES